MIKLDAYLPIGLIIILLLAGLVASYFIILEAGGALRELFTSRSSKTSETGRAPAEPKSGPDSR